MVMNINNLKIFIQVADRMSITEAANDLYISQPAVSKAIRNIEGHLNIKLFHRDKKTGLVLTEVGNEILLLARQMIGIENKIQQISFRENNLLGGNVRIGSFPSASTIIMSKAIALFKKTFPLVSVELIEGSSNQVKKWVEDRVVDFGIVISPFKGYDFKLLIRDKMVGIVTEDRKKLKAIDLKTQQNNLIFCKGGYETAISQTLKDYKIDFSESFTVQNAETVISMVQNHIGIGVISEFVLSSLTHNLEICEIDPLIEMQIGLIAHSFDDLSPVATEFVNIITKS